MTLLAVHTPVMKQEVLAGLAVTVGGRYVDCTLGAAGHAGAVLVKSQPGGQLLGLEADPLAVDVARENLAAFGPAVLILNENFVHLEATCQTHEFQPVSGVLFDLGVSSLQLSPEGRGFSFQHDAPLDMRFSPRQSYSAADIVNTYTEEELARLIYEYGEEERSRQIARAIVRTRPLTSTTELAVVIEKVSPGYHRLHPATRTFQALRIATNDELTHLSSALEQAVNVLGHGGRLVVISYHSLEDRIVKGFLRREAATCLCPPGLPQCVCQHTPRLILKTRGALTPSLAEISANPRSRSAKMRIAERITTNEPSRRRPASRPSKILMTSRN